MENEYDARFREFGEEYDDFEADDVRNLIICVGDRLAAICLDDNAVDAAMKCLHRHLGLSDFPTDFDGDRSWRALWKRTPSGDLLDLPLAQRLTGLNAYAYYGLSPTHDGQPCTVDDVKNVIDAIKTAVGLDNIDRSVTAELDRTLLAAQGRLALDEGGAVAPDQLAALARLGLKSIRNALAPSSGSGLELKNGAVVATSALKWLSARGDFKSSIWHDDMTTAPAAEPVSSATGEILWIPFASDDTEFVPKSCRRGNNYTVGPKGSEQTFADYRQALDYLARMRPSAYWRRPNTVGNWGIVTAVGFRPRTIAELGLLSNQGEEK